MKIAVIDKSLNNTKYSKHYGIQDLDVYHMCSKKLEGRLLKKDIDLGTESNPFNPEEYDFVILVGAEPFKAYAGKTGIGDYSGKRVEHNGYSGWLASISPAMLHFKPEMKPLFEDTVESFHAIINGNEKTAKQGNWKPIQTEKEAEEYVKTVFTMTSGAVAFDSETSALYARDGYVLGLSMSHEEYQGVYIESDVINEVVVHYLQKIIDSPNREIVFHNLKFDMHMYKYHFGLDFERPYLENRLHDTMLQHYVLDERRGTHGLKQLAMKYTDMGDYDFDLDQFKDNYCKAHKIKKEDFTYDLIPFEIMWPYAAKDTDATIRLHHFFLPKIEKNPNLKKLYYDLLIPATMFLTRVEDRGVPISKDRLKEAQVQLVERLREAEKELYTYQEVHDLEKAQGKQFNPNSVQQLRVLLFDYLKLAHTGKLTGTGAISTDAEVLQELADQHPLAKTLLAIRKTKKLISTYVEKILQSIDADGRVRTGFHLQTTTSGRLSSSGKLNLQQLPRDESIIKGCIVAPKGYKIVSWDLTTAEVYVAAVLSGDRNLQKIFLDMQNDPENSADFHSMIAHMVFNPKCTAKELKKLYPSLRQASKAITFGILFGSGAAKVASSINESLLEESIKTGMPYEPCTKAQAQSYIDKYFKTFSRLKKWIDDSHSQILVEGYIYGHFGRKRRLLNIHSEDRGVQGEELRSGFNAIIQGASSDNLLKGAILADEEIIKKGLQKEMQIIMLVHDSVVALVREDLVDQYNEILLRNVKADRGLSIPGCPIGMESDSEDGGSVDYSCGKIKKQHPSIACIDDPEFRSKIQEVCANESLDYIKSLSNDSEIKEFYKKYEVDPKAYVKDYNNLERLGFVL